jgi:hypothetical protein
LLSLELLHTGNLLGLPVVILQLWRSFQLQKQPVQRQADFLRFVFLQILQEIPKIPGGFLQGYSSKDTLGKGVPRAMEDDPAAGEADLPFPRDYMTSSGEEPSEDDQELAAGHSPEEDTEEEAVDEEEDDLPAHESKKVLKRPREESSEEEEEEGDGNDVLGMPPHKRGLEAMMRDYAETDGLDDEEDDDSDDSDEDWNPWGLKPVWNCINCTTPTPEEYTFCQVSLQKLVMIIISITSCNSCLGISLNLMLQFIIVYVRTFHWYGI